jgi:hypothetical protein
MKYLWSEAWILQAIAVAQVMNGKPTLPNLPAVRGKWDVSQPKFYSMPKDGGPRRTGGTGVPTAIENWIIARRPGLAEPSQRL